MRVLGFTKKWSKLEQDLFTTYRFPRKDHDWYVGENVQLVYHPRSRDRELLGHALIIGRTLMWVEDSTLKEAIADGFLDQAAMLQWFMKTYGHRVLVEKMNRLELRRIDGDRP